jgi:outer membrane protein assembly factor BamB
VAEGGAVVFETPGEVVAVDPANGRRIWSTGRSPGPVAPVAVDDTVPGGQVVYTEGSGSTASVVAMSLADRKVRWAFTLPRASLGGPTIDAGTVFVGTTDGSVFAIDAAEGGQRWRASTSGAVVGPPAAAGGRVFASAFGGSTSPSHVYAWNARTGKQLWDVTQSQGLVGVSTVTVAGDRVYVGMGSGVHAINAETGDVLWTTVGSPSGSASYSPASAPAVAGGSVFVLDAGGHLGRFRASDGARLWDFLFDANSTRSSALVAGDVVYAGLDDGSVGAVSIPTGNGVWRSTAERGPVGPLAPAGELLLVPHLGGGGSLAAMGHTAGALTDVVSPSRLNVGRALLNFLVAAVIVALGAAAFGAVDARGRAGERTASA